jgi:hypothetical protein
MRSISLTSAIAGCSAIAIELITNRTPAIYAMMNSYAFTYWLRKARLHFRGFGRWLIIVPGGLWFLGSRISCDRDEGFRPARHLAAVTYHLDPRPGCPHLSTAGFPLACVAHLNGFSGTRIILIHIRCWRKLKRFHASIEHYADWRDPNYLISDGRDPTTTAVAQD